MKVLVPVDQSPSSEKLVAKLASLFGPRSKADMSFTLFHVIEKASFLGFPSASWSETLEKASAGLVTHLQGEATKLLDAHKASLVAAGVPADCITTKAVVREGRPEAQRVLAALAIIDEMQAGGYDLVTVGRRGANATAATFIGSVAEKVSRETHGRSLLVVD